MEPCPDSAILKNYGPGSERKKNIDFITKHFFATIGDANILNNINLKQKMRK